MPSTTTKPWYTSMTLWSAVFGLLAFLLKNWGYKVSDSFTTEGPQDVMKLITLMGFAGAIAGRTRATKRLTLTVLLVSLFILQGCTALSGKSSQQLAEEALTTSFDSVNTFIQIEAQNDVLIRQKAPAVAQLADNLRETFPPTFKLAEAAVKVYVSDPTTVNKAAADALENQVISNAQQSAVAIQQINTVSSVKYAPLAVPKHR